MTRKNGEAIRKTKNLKYLRTSNRAEIIRCLATQGPISRIELSRQLGLTKMAISAIVNEMIEVGLVSEQGTNPITTDRQPSLVSGRPKSSAGRKPCQLILCASRIRALGLYLSRDAIDGVLCDVTGKIEETWHAPLFETIDSEQYQNLLASVLDQMTTQTRDMPLIGIGISCIGPLDLAAGKLLDPPNFFSIHDLPLVDLVKKHSKLPVILDNDMNAAVLAEQLYGAAKNFNHVIYLGLTNGVGAGIVSYGRIFQGGNGFGGEIGHMSLDFNGPVCSCGNRGCLELYASIPVLLAKSGSRNLREMVDKVMREPESPPVWLSSLLESLTAALTSMVNLFDPEIILLGHQSVHLEPILLPKLEIAMNEHIFQRASKHVPIRMASFGEQSPLVGATALIFHAAFRGEIPLE